MVQPKDPNKPPYQSVKGCYPKVSQLAGSYGLHSIVGDETIKSLKDMENKILDKMQHLEDTVSKYFK